MSAVDENGFCLGQKLMEKTNEIKAISELLDCLDIKGTIITTDAMGTQMAIAKKIRQRYADYVLALKANQGNLLEERTIFYKQSANRDRRNRACSTGALDGGELPLVFRRDIPGRREPHIRKTGIL